MKKDAIATLDGKEIELTKEGVPDMLEAVKKQIGLITKGMPKTTKTSAAPDGFPKSVAQCESVEELIKMHSFINAKDKAYTESVKELKLTPANYPSKISGHKPDVWKKDIAARLNIVKNKEKLDKLKQVKTILEANLSEKAKFQKQMGDMVDILQDLKVD